MLLISCPWCGDRAEHEFVCAGETRLALSADHAPSTDHDCGNSWAEALYGRDNPRGWVRELWWHVHGCQQWLAVTRHTVTHAITSVETTRAAVGGSTASGTEGERHR